MYKQKYLKYKNKYLQLKNKYPTMYGGDEKEEMLASFGLDGSIPSKKTKEERDSNPRVIVRLVLRNNIGIDPNRVLISLQDTFGEDNVIAQQDNDLDEYVNAIFKDFINENDKNKVLKYNLLNHSTAKTLLDNYKIQIDDDEFHGVYETDSKLTDFEDEIMNYVEISGLKISYDDTMLVPMSGAGRWINLDNIEDAKSLLKRDIPNNGIYYLYITYDILGFKEETKCLIL